MPFSLEEISSLVCCTDDGKAFARFIPPTRLMVRLAGANASLSQTAAAYPQEGRAWDLSLVRLPVKDAPRGRE